MNDPLAYQVARAREREIERIVNRPDRLMGRRAAAQRPERAMAPRPAPHLTGATGARFLHTR